MPTEPTIAVHLHADVAQAVEGFTDARMNTLSMETGLPASVWREAHDLAGDDDLFKQAVQMWREDNPDGESPAGIVRTLLAVRTPPVPGPPTTMADLDPDGGAR